MNNRIIWIDWAKAIGIMIVVYCHIPQENSFFKSFLCSFQMPLFFLIAGYLHKDSPKTLKDSIKKYWKTLIIPYILFQFIFYPYWLVQRHVQEGLNLTNYMDSVVTPFIQCLWSIPIDGVTWFIYALLITKLIADLSLKNSRSTLIIIFLCICSMVGAWFIWQDDKLNITFTIDSLFNFFPFFFIGYYLKKYNIIKEDTTIRCIINTAICFIISYITINYSPDSYLSQRISFYLLGISGSFFIINVCKLTRRLPSIIQTISIGNIIILGLHWMFIGTTNQILKEILNLQGEIKYNIFESIILVLFITFINIGIIKICQKHFKPLLGYR